MEHRILIVDDDQIFNSLLSDVFRQAGYQVSSAPSAEEAEKFLKQAEVDLIVTDNRMPGTSGVDFVQNLMHTHKGLPVVMVSGFLSNDDIRQLIRDGIGGIFIKPLNIFQLLKRAAMLIERRKTTTGTPEGEANDEESDTPRNEGPVSFQGARSAAAMQFFKQLEGLREFSSNLLLVGNEGTDFETVCTDLSNPRTDTIFFIAPEELDDPTALAARIAGLATQDQGRLTLVLDRIEDLDKKRAETVFSISRCNAPFDRLGKPVRFIFCLRNNLDELFEAGKIDENLYLFMGTMEIRIPSLNELAGDIPAIAQAMLDRMREGQCKLEDAAATALKDMDWPGGSRQLKSVLQAAATATGEAWISLHTITDSYEGRLASPAEENLTEDSLKHHLTCTKNDYVAAIMELFHSDTSTAAKALGIPPENFPDPHSIN